MGHRTPPAPGSSRTPSLCLLCPLSPSLSASHSSPDTWMVLWGEGAGHMRFNLFSCLYSGIFVSAENSHPMPCRGILQMSVSKWMNSVSLVDGSQARWDDRSIVLSSNPTITSDKTSIFISICLTFVSDSRLIQSLEKTRSYLLTLWNPNRPIWSCLLHVLCII